MAQLSKKQTVRGSKSLISVLILGLAGTGCTADGIALDPRFKMETVSFVQEGTTMGASGVSGKSSDVSAMASGLSISLALSILPPATFNTGGTQLYASDLKVVGNKVITGYNVPGSVQKGWIDYIDVTTIAVPLLLDSKYLSDTDVNSIAMKGGKFALVGAKEGVGATLRTGTYGLGLSLGTSDTSLPSYAGTGITFDSTGANLGMTSGDGGKVTVMNATSLVNAGVPASLADARGIDYSSVTGKYYVVSGQPGAVTSYSTAGAQVATRSLGGASISESKATVQAGSTFLLASTGDGGFSVICAADMQVAATQAQFSFGTAGLPVASLTVTNAAVFGPGMIFTAAGQAGVRVYNFTKKAGASPTSCQNVQVSYMGYFEFGNTISVNNLYYQNVLTTAITYTGTLYVAAGEGGFKAVTVVATRNALNDIIEY